MKNRMSPMRRHSRFPVRWRVVYGTTKFVTEGTVIDSPAFTGGVLSEFKLRLSRVFLPLSGYVPPDNLFCNPDRGHKVPG